MSDKFNTTHKYDDIINLPHHVSRKHPHMDILDRAAQFSPFMALTGYEDAVEETARLTDDWIEPDEESKTILNEKLCIIGEHTSEKPIVKITYFQPDMKKDGGAYVTITGAIRRIDWYNAAIIMADKTAILIENIIDMQSEIFDITDFNE